MDRVILHCDLNNFYASCECLKRPEYRNVPIIVSGSTDSRHGVVLAKNDLAKKAGIKTGDVIWQAKQKIAGLITVKPDFDMYTQMSKKVFDIYTRYTSLVEPFGADECWLDVTGSKKLFGDGLKIADTLREVVKKETGGLTLSVGVSFSKPYSKLASDMKKPDATTVLSKANFQEHAWGLPVGEFMMAGRKTSEKLSKLNIKTIGDIALAEDTVLHSLLGVNGIKLKQSVLGINNEPVREYIKARIPLSVGHGMTAVRDIITYDDAEALIFYLADLVAVRMRKYGLTGSGIAVSLRDNALKIISKQTVINTPTKNATDIGKTAFSLTKSIWSCSPPLRSITVSVYDVSSDDGNIQTTMFSDNENIKNDKLDAALDKIRIKYGAQSIKRANLIERDFIYDKTESEDFLPFQR